MKIQLAIDRMTIEKAIDIGRKAFDYIDILEVGTSYIKDYGMAAVTKIKEAFPDKIILADIKTFDEGEYEFNAAFMAGADIATVMGAAPIDTVEICCEAAYKNGRQVMIDLMECSADKIKFLEGFKEAIQCIHLGKDSKNKNFQVEIKKFEHTVKAIPHLAVAGGINLKTIPALKTINPEIIVIGSAITKSENITEAAGRLWEKVHEL